MPPCVIDNILSFGLEMQFLAQLRLNQDTRYSHFMFKMGRTDHAESLNNESCLRCISTSFVPIIYLQG